MYYINYCINVNANQILYNNETIKVILNRFIYFPTNYRIFALSASIYNIQR